MQEIFTFVTYLITWLICSYILGIESGLGKLLISLTAAILVYVLIGMARSRKAEDKNGDDA